KKAGASLEENAAYIEETLPRTCIWFTVDDLEYLKRGGRVSPAVAFVGGLLGIKPILKINDEGELIKVGTARGKKKSLEALADRFTELADDLTTPIFISHADSEEHVRTFANIIKQRHNADLTLVTEIGAVIGSHTGPGTLALFFLGKHR
ncbi:MAG: DegV family protein, partial [Eubacteriales bacterium]|nr:DegV family protein [Eubacteriales bacterium]